MEQNRKSPFADIIEKKVIEAKLQKLSYVKVKVTFHHNDKSTRTITYRCSMSESLMRLTTSLRNELKLKQHQSIFLYSHKRLIDIKQRICDLKNLQGSGTLMLEAATSDIF